LRNSGYHFLGDFNKQICSYVFRKLLHRFCGYAPTGDAGLKAAPKHSGRQCCDATFQCCLRRRVF
jgi:hypothetical protein